ncbi:MAG: hypothetical protein ABI644_05490 [Arenimonas sp.]
MILRRLSQSLKEQNWTAIVIEFVLLVVGVFLGIQVANWNAELETQKKAEIFTKRLTADLRLEAWGYEGLIEYYTDVTANADRTLAVMADEAQLSDEQFVVSAYRATQYKYNDRYRATYDEMVSTGSIGLIADQKLRETAIITFTSPIFDEISEEGRKSEYRELFRRAVSKDVQRELQSKCGDRFVDLLDYKGIVKSLDYPCTLDVPAEKISAAAKALRSNQNFVPSLQSRFADVETAIGNLRDYNPKLFNNLQEISGRKK